MAKIFGGELGWGGLGGGGVGGVLIETQLSRLSSHGWERGDSRPPDIR